MPFGNYCIGNSVVGEAGDLNQAIRFIESANPDLILLDVHMPIGPGLTIDEVRGRLRLYSIPILAISIFVDNIARGLANDIGATVLLDKMNLGQDVIPAIIKLASGDCGKSKLVN